MRLVSKNKTAILVRKDLDVRGRIIPIYRRIFKDTNKYLGSGEPKPVEQAEEQKGSGVPDVQAAQAPVGEEVQVEGQTA